MKRANYLTLVSYSGAILLTLFLALGLSGCVFVQPADDKPEVAPMPPNSECKSHAYVRHHLTDYLTSRYSNGAPVRMAILPFSVPANLSAFNMERPGEGNQLARQVQAAFMRAGAVPIVEVLNRYDWPGKKEEFFTGNFGAITTARDAGYDLVLIGYLDDPRSLRSITAYTKLIDVEAGITVWYGESSVTRTDSAWHNFSDFFVKRAEKPSSLNINQLFDGLALCISGGILENEPVP